MKKVKKPPHSKIGGGSSTKPKPPSSVASPKPRQPAKATKIQVNHKHLPGQLAVENWRLLKELWRVAYIDLGFMGRGILWVIQKWHEELIRIILLLIVMFLEYRIPLIFLFHHR